MNSRLLLFIGLVLLLSCGAKTGNYRATAGPSTPSTWVTRIKMKEVSFSRKSADDTFEAIFRAYSMYMYHPRVIEALSRGDREVKSVPVKVRGKVKKVTFTYPKPLVDFVKYCTESGGEVRPGYIPLLPIPEAQTEGKYVDVIEHRKGSRFVRKYPVYICLKGKEHVKVLLSIPVSRVKKKREVRESILTYKMWTSRYSDDCLARYEQDLLAQFIKKKLTVCVFYPKLFFSQADSPDGLKLPSYDTVLSSSGIKGAVEGLKYWKCPERYVRYDQVVVCSGPSGSN